MISFRLPDDGHQPRKVDTGRTSPGGRNRYNSRSIRVLPSVFGFA